MDAAQALADLTEISSQIEAAGLFDAGGAVEGSTLGDDAAAKGLADAAVQLLAEADRLRGEEAAVTQLQVSLADGCVFVVRDGDRRIAGTTVPSPTVGLVFYDLKSALRDSAPAGGDAGPEKPKRRTRSTDDEA